MADLFTPEWSRIPTSDIFGGITGAEDGSSLTVGPDSGPWNDGTNGSVTVLVDNGALRHYFDGTIIVGLRKKVDSYQMLDVPRKITTAGGGQLDSVAQGLPRVISIDGKVKCVVRSISRVLLCLI